MRIATRVAGVAGAAALGTMVMSSVAFADSAGNEGVNLLDDNNASVLPVQLCGNNVSAVIGVIIPVGSPQVSECTNAPVTDHASNNN